MFASFVRATAFVCVCSLGSLSLAQHDMLESSKPKATEDSSWYGAPTTPQQLTPRMIIQQKAQMRAYQRMARMESLKWYGFSASRPLSNATPFAGVPAPRYEMPGGRPFSWYPYQGPSVVIVR